MKKIISLALTAFLLMATLMTGCGEAPKGKVIRIGYFPNVTHAPALIGFGEKRFEQEFKKDGVTLEEKIFVAGPSLMEALIAGEIDIGYIGPIPSINGFVQGAKISVISGANSGGAILVAGKDSGVKSVKDLVGKKIAIPQFANTQDISLRKILKQNGLKDKAKGGSVEIIQIAPADMTLLLTRGEIDAVLVPEPWGTLLIDNANAHVILEWDQIWNNGNYPTTLIIAKNEFITENPQLINRWLEIHGEIVSYINSHPKKAEKTIELMLKELTGKDFNPKVLESAVARCRFTTELDPQIMNEFAGLSYEAGYLKTKPELTSLLSQLEN